MTLTYLKPQVWKVNFVINQNVTVIARVSTCLYPIQSYLDSVIQSQFKEGYHFRGLSGKKRWVASITLMININNN